MMYLLESRILLENRNCGLPGRTESRYRLATGQQIHSSETNKEQLGNKLFFTVTAITDLLILNQLILNANCSDTPFFIRQGLVPLHNDNTLGFCSLWKFTHYSNTA